MPTPGEIVCFYTHEVSDSTHQTIDCVAIVLAATDDYVDLKVFEKGEVPYDERAYAYTGPEYDAAGNLIQGKSYWREIGSEPPDFAEAPLTTAIEEEPFVEEVDPPIPSTPTKPAFKLPA